MKDDTEQPVLGGDSIREALKQMDKETERKEGWIWCAGTPAED